MKKEAVQHERAPRPIATDQHQLTLQKLGYNLSRQQQFIPAPAPLPFSSFQQLQTFNGFVPAFSESNIHNSFLDRSPFQDFPCSKFPDTISEVPQLNPLFGTQVGSLNSLSPFKIPLFSTALRYPVSHPGYLSTNIFYPAVIPTDASPSSAPTLNKHIENEVNVTLTSSIHGTEVQQKPDSQLSEKLKEDEVSSSEEVFKTVCKSGDVSKEENTKRYYESIQTESKKLSLQDNWKLMSDTLYDPVAKLLVATVKWLHGLGSFIQMKNTEQITLLQNNWKELFILTAAQYSFFFHEEYISPEITSKWPNVKDDLKKLTYLLKRISQQRLDKTEYEWIKAVLLYRTETTESPLSLNIEMLQEQILILLQKHCAMKDVIRFGRIMLLLPSICCFTSCNVLERILFPTSSIDEINTTLSRLLLYTSM
ncbi:hypothetical protein O3G_MSEX010136 [Manduca sexta]|nr:hypothetical protein O3G_MSEX010136 [Manduca sexta]